YRPNLFKALFDGTGLIRATYHSLTDEKVDRSDVANYWGGMDDKFMQQIGDHNALHADATSPALSSATYRYQRGRAMGETILKQIKSGEIELAKDAKGNVIETFKLVGHSQGVAASAGIADVLIENGYKVEASYNIAPKQPGDIKFNSKVGRVVQYGSKKDIIAPQSPINATDLKKGRGPEKDGPIQGHLLSNYGNIFEHRNGKDDNVLPRTDVKQNNAYLLSIILLLNLLFGNCVSKKQKLKCLNEIINSNHNDREYIEMKKAIHDSIIHWAMLGLSEHKVYLYNKWKVDDFLFNSKRDKLFGWIIDLGKESDKLNFLDFFIGEKLNGRWYYYTHNIAGSIWYDKTKNYNKTYTFKHISNSAKRQFIDGGLFKWNSCTIDDDYIEGWQRENENGYKLSMYQDHLKFLNRQGMYKTDDTDSVSTNSHDKN
ncbi:unnamed protein product, partial [Rotaria socialis]